MAAQWSPDCVAVDSIDRSQLRGEVDARVADLYGLSELDFAFILSTFPLLDRDQPALPEEPKSFITRDLALLALFTLRGKEPPDNIISFFATAGVDIRHQTGAIVDLRKRALQSHLLGTRGGHGQERAQPPSARLCPIEVWQRYVPGWQASSSPSRQDSACRYDDGHSEKPTKSASADHACSLDAP